MTPSEVITQVRQLIQDTGATQRYTDATLLGFVNQTIKRMVVLRPDLFAEYGELTTTANTPLQSLPSDSMRLIEIYQVKNGNALTEVNRETMDQGYPNWVSDPSGTPYNFMRHARNPNKYFLYPRPIPGIVLLGEYAKVPDTFSLGDTITGLPDAYLPSLVDGTVFLAASVDDEHVNSGRAKLFLEAFNAGLANGLSNRPLTDDESAGVARGGQAR